MGRTTILAGVVLALAGCSRERPLVVGSKNFTEQVILGEIVAQHLERRLGVPVERKLNLGGTLLAHQALTAGQIDVYPEYTGTALTAILKQPISSDPAAVLATVRGEYRQRWQLEWLEPLGFNNTFAMVVRGGAAATLSEAASRKQGWRLGVGYEFITRPDGLDGLVKTYRLPLDGTPKSMDLGLLYKALEQGQVDMVAGNVTDGLIDAMKLTVLADDRAYFPPYYAALVAGPRALAIPGLKPALAELSGKFSDRAMRQLNYLVDGRHRPVRDVAREFLAAW
ncbi:MAG: glycine betaine ABC transporter substrate-binding protein [Bryobacteraceae bacterium]